MQHQTPNQHEKSLKIILFQVQIKIKEIGIFHNGCGQSVVPNHCTGLLDCKLSVVADLPQPK